MIDTPAIRKQDAGINADFDDEFEMVIDDDDYELDHIKVGLIATL